jgi:DNA-binding transcriptional regulator LsrR (DeoR family)
VRAHVQAFHRATARLEKAEAEVAAARLERGRWLKEMWLAGLTYDRIAERVGMSRARVHQLIDAYDKSVEQ